MEFFLFFCIIMQKCKFDVIEEEFFVVDSKYGLMFKLKDFKVYVLVRK